MLLLCGLPATQPLPQGYPLYEAVECWTDGRPGRLKR